MGERAAGKLGKEAVLATAALALTWAANLSIAGSDALQMRAGDMLLPAAGAVGVTGALVFGGAVPGLIRRRLSRRLACAIAALFFVALTVGALVIDPSGASVSVLAILRLLFGMGIGCLLVMAAAPLMAAPRLPAALAFVSAVLTGTVAYLLVENIPSPFDVVASAALAVLACLMALIAPEEDDPGAAGARPSGGKGPAPGEKTLVPTGFWPLALGLAAYSIVYGIAIAITLALGGGEAHLTPIKLVLLVPAIVTGSLVFRFQDTFDFRRFQWFLFLPSVVALLPLPFVGTQVGLALCGVLVLVFGFYDLASFILLLDLGRARTWRLRVRIFAWGRAANTAGMFAGWLIASRLLAAPLAGQPAEPGDLGLVACAFAAVALLALAMTCFGSPALSVARDDAPREGRWKRACRAVAERGGLSPREAEVFELLAKGNGAERIAEELFIAVPTVKTHSYRLYQKLGVHSQQELIDLVEAEKSALPR